MNKEDREYFTRCMTDIIIVLSDNNRLLESALFNLNVLGWIAVAMMFIGALIVLSGLI